MSILIKLKNILKKIAGISTSQNNYPSNNKKDSWSQSGEDIIIEYLFSLRKIVAPTCLDIGAFDPVILNNTHKFFLKGSKIVSIDANPLAIKKFMIERPGSINLNIGIGSTEGEFNFYIMEDPVLNTFSEEEKSSLEKFGHKVSEVIKVKTIGINQVFEEYFKDTEVDFLSIDAEGVDFDIIKSLDFLKYQPKVICIESINYTPDGTGTKRIDLCNYIETAGYFEYANTNINSIFVFKQWWFS